MTLKKKLLGALLLLLAGYFLLCFAYYLYQEKLIFHPEPLAEDYQFQYDEPFEEVWINTADGEKVNALHFKAVNSKGVVLYFHGNAGNLSNWGVVASQFLPYNYDLFIMDYRGFGKSTGALNEYKLHQDAIACFNYLEDLGFESRDIFIYGRSIGSGVASKLSRERWSKGLILESPFSNMVFLANHYVPFLPHGLLLRYKFPNDSYIRHINNPVYVIHGTKDRVIPYELALKLKNLNDRVIFYTIENGGHNDLSSFSEFDNIMKTIFEK